MKIAKMIDEQFIKNYTPLLNKIARKYTRNKWDFEDCRQELYMKLLECLMNYDHSKGVPLVAYVNICCTHRAISFARDNNKEHYMEMIVDDPDNPDEDAEEDINSLYEYFLEIYNDHENGGLAKDKYVEGYSTKELAEREDVTCRCIDKRIEKFNKWFKEEVEDL